MRGKWLGTCLLVAASAGLCLAADASRPRCNKKTAGQMWPDAANHDQQLQARLARCGELQMCVREAWRYRWELLTVRIDQLPGGSGLGKPAACEISLELVDHSRESASNAAR